MTAHLDPSALLVQPVVPAQPTGGASTLLVRALKTRRGRLGFALAGVVLIVAIVGPAVAPDSPSEFVTAPLAQPDASHLLGGDALGRDVLSRLLSGGWEILLMSAVATALGVGIGGALGMFAAFERGVTDSIVMRTVDVVLAFPQLVFALLLLSVAGASPVLIIVAVTLSHAPPAARVIRSAALDVCERDYVTYGELIALPRRRIIASEILPSLTSPLMVEAGLRFTWSVITIAGLSFLGFGLQPPSPNWGTMINENRVGLTLNPWGVIAPAVAIAVLTVGVNTFTDAIARVSLGVDRRR